MEEAWLSRGSPQHPVGPVLDYSLRQMNDGAINVYDGLDLEVGSIVPWSTELNVCLGAIKTSLSCILITVWLLDTFARVLKVARLYL